MTCPVRGDHMLRATQEQCPYCRSRAEAFDRYLESSEALGDTPHPNPMVDDDGCAWPWPVG